jgi:hypothetical protein
MAGAGLLLVSAGLGWGWHPAAGVVTLGSGLIVAAMAGASQGGGKQ